MYTNSGEFSFKVKLKYEAPVGTEVPGIFSAQIILISPGLFNRHFTESPVITLTVTCDTPSLPTLIVTDSECAFTDVKTQTEKTSSTNNILNLIFRIIDLLFYK